MTPVIEEFIREVKKCPDLKLVAIASGFAAIRTRADSLAIITLPRSWAGWTRRGKILGVMEEVYDRVNRRGRFNRTPKQELSGFKTLKQIYRQWDIEEQKDII